MRNFCLPLLRGISLLGLSGHMFPNDFPAVVRSVITAIVKMLLLFLDLFKFF